MDSAAIRKTFLDFFTSKGHAVVPPAPLVPRDDATLLFTNSGMVQFKNYFLGYEAPTHLRVADAQQCLRVSGKHNDLDDVGFDTYHHTLFEMLGNWSFGDYFKKEAIAWAWELLVDVYKLPVDRLYVTVFGGDPTEGLEPDTEAMGYWKSVVGKERILFGGKKDNFWEMGEIGPCGPCSEIHIDLRSEAEIVKTPGSQLVNADHPQVIEIWNLVFIQFNRLASGNLEELPQKHVDTGMGFERLCRAIQGKTSNYDTDIFLPLIELIAQAAQTPYGQDEKKDVAMRVIADHIRAVAFTIAENQSPSNIGAGYVVRRILRRAVRYGLSYLGFKEPFLHRLLPLLAESSREVFPVLSQRLRHVTEVTLEEERSFLKTLEKGLARMDAIRAETTDKIINGEVVFELYDTYGFPPDLTAIIAKENHIEIDEAGFERAMERQKARSKSVVVQEAGDWAVVHQGDAVEFVGYDTLQTSSRLLRYRVVRRKDQTLYQLVFQRTPFYAESGGQVGDIGSVRVGDDVLRIVDAKKENQLIVHFTERLPDDLAGEFTLAVDTPRRQAITGNHSATHLMHAALRRVLGDHVEQRGSLVHPQGLRFDFSHPMPMKAEEIDRIEQMVNRRIRMNIPLDECRAMPLAEAKKMGATALFGEKYGDVVRVVTFDSDYSMELCGGTHVPSTGHIGFFKVVSEGAIAAGVRRIEAVTAEDAEQYVRRDMMLLREVSGVLKHPKAIADAVQHLLAEKNALERKITQLHHQQADALQEKLARKIEPVNGVRALIDCVKLPDVYTLRRLAHSLCHHHEDLFLTLAADLGGKPHIIVMLGAQAQRNERLHAGRMVKELARAIDGDGGGKPNLAMAGGKNLNGLINVLKMAKALLASGGWQGPA